MLPALTAHLKPISSGLSVLLQTTLARLLPCLWWAAPPDNLFHLPPLVIMSWRPQSCHCSLCSCRSKQRWWVFHTSRCSFDSALWSLPLSSLAPAAQALWFPQPRLRPGPFLGCVFSAVTKRRLLSAFTAMALKDMTVNLGLRCC